MRGRSSAFHCAGWGGTQCLAVSQARTSGSCAMALKGCGSLSSPDKTNSGGSDTHHTGAQTALSQAGERREGSSGQSSSKPL